MQNQQKLSPYYYAWYIATACLKSVVVFYVVIILAMSITLIFQIQTPMLLIILVPDILALLQTL